MQIVILVSTIVILRCIGGLCSAGHIIRLGLKHVGQTADAAGLHAQNRNQIGICNIIFSIQICTNNGCNLTHVNCFTIIQIRIVNLIVVGNRTLKRSPCGVNEVRYFLCLYTIASRAGKGNIGIYSSCILNSSKVCIGHCSKVILTFVPTDTVHIVIPLDISTTNEFSVNKDLLMRLMIVIAVIVRRNETNMGIALIYKCITVCIGLI